MKLYQLTERVFLDASKKKVVPADSPEATFFLGPQGHEIPYEYAKQLGLVEQATVEEETPPVTEEETVEQKAVTEFENKAITLSDHKELSEHVQSLLREYYSSEDEIRQATDQELLSKNGIGPSILMDIREVYPYQE